MQFGKAFYTIIFILLFCQYIDGQPKSYWYQFRDKKTKLIGYKDKNSHIKIPAKFSGLTGAVVFDHIIAVEDDKTRKLYYILKNGKETGRDSVYVWDYTFDREQEGKIRFRDPKTDKVGFFDKQGKITIPAIYNDALPFNNGLALVIHDGKRVCADKSCEHWSWNGINALIDTHNNIIADHINTDEIDNIEWSTLKITNSPPDPTLYNFFKAKNGKFYSFLNHKREFEKWFHEIFLPNLEQQKLTASCYKEIIVEENFAKNGRIHYSRASFLNRYETIMIEKMKNIKENKIKTNIFKDELNDLIYIGKNFSIFYTKDGVPDNQLYPVFNVVTTYDDKNEQLGHQDQFLFIRTADGYKLIEVALKI